LARDSQTALADNKQTASSVVSARYFPNDDGLFTLLRIARIIFESQMAHDPACAADDSYARLRGSPTNRQTRRRFNLRRFAFRCAVAFLGVILMNYKTLITAVALIAVPFASAEPKAYDTVFYKGKAAGLKIAFEFGHDYVEASNVKITESVSGKTTKFYLSGRDRLRTIARGIIFSRPCEVCQIRGNQMKGIK
jgi:hypothetical protein